MTSTGQKRVFHPSPTERFSVCVQVKLYVILFRLNEFNTWLPLPLSIYFFSKLLIALEFGTVHSKVFAM